MNMLSRLFSRKRITDFGKMTEKSLNTWIEDNLDLEDTFTHNFVTEEQGKAFSILHTVNESPLIYKISGFSNTALVPGDREVKAGDTMILPSKTGEKILCLVLTIEHISDPEDMFFALLAPIDIKEDVDN